jgi:hypothetical protein
MPRMPRLPEDVARLFAPLKPYFRYRHYPVLRWLVGSAPAARRADVDRGRILDL